MTTRIHKAQIKIGTQIDLTSQQAHYLFKVMRKSAGDDVKVFNEIDGEFTCKITQISKEKCTILPLELVKNYTPTQKVICVFSVIKHKNIELIIQKCTEIGIAEFFPLQSQRCSIEAINFSRLEAIAIEATEQCGRIDVPRINKAITIKQLEAMQGEQRAFYLLNQNGKNFIKETQRKEGESKEIFIICGPEGGFSETEIETISNFATKIKISQNILRAETAAMLGCGLFMI